MPGTDCGVLGWVLSAELKLTAGQAASAPFVESATTARLATNGPADVLVQWGVFRRPRSRVPDARRQKRPTLLGVVGRTLDRYWAKATMLQSRANKTAIYQWQDGRRLQRRAPQMQSDLGRRRWVGGSAALALGTRQVGRPAGGQQGSRCNRAAAGICRWMRAPKRHMYAREEAR